MSVCPSYISNTSLRLKRLYSAEQTEELRGISTTADFPMYLLIAYNTFLDMFMVCFYITFEYLHGKH
jgi:hypothetical protein